jgi:hypothetical protein
METVREFGYEVRELQNGFVKVEGYAPMSREQLEVFVSANMRANMRGASLGRLRGLPVPIMHIARIAHEVNRAYCAAIGDDSAKSWEDASDHQRRSAVLGVEFHQLNPDAGPEASHDSWMRKKMDDGWAYGGVKDEDAKIHPCMVPFVELPLEQQVKDHLFRAVVCGLLSIWRAWF